MAKSKTNTRAIGLFSSGLLIFVSVALINASNKVNAIAFVDKYVLQFIRYSHVCNAYEKLINIHTMDMRDS